MKIYSSNLLTALDTAIKVQTEQEKELGYTGKSGMLAGWEQLKEAIMKGERIEIVEY